MMDEAVLTIRLAPGTPPETVAEIIRAVETIHLALAGYLPRVTRSTEDA